MELGQRLRQARQEAGLSQRQLCGDVITRNMLSQIENGSARPSMDTLRYFARQLGKPVSYFLEEVQASPNQTRMAQLRQASAGQVPELLKDYEAPDELFDPERYLLEVLACLELAQTAIDENRRPYAANLLEQAKQAGEKTPYYTPELERRRLLLCHRANTEPAAQLVNKLPPLEEELLLRAQAALETGDPARGRALLEAMERKDGQWYLAMGKALLAQSEYAAAAEALQKAEQDAPMEAYALLEQCYTALEDYKSAYEYVCKQRQRGEQA